MRRTLLAGALAAAVCGAALSLPLAAEQSPKGQWINLSDAVVAKLADENLKPGYAGPTAGVAVDPASGDLYMVVNDLGLFKSTDRGATFARCDSGAIGGRCETAFAIDADPAGRRLAVFVVYGSSAVTLDAGKTWTKSKASHVDIVAVDWTDGKSMLALRHEAGGMLTLSTDGGAAWTDLAKGFSRLGLFDPKTLVATKEKEPGIFRSTDSGATWAKVSDLVPSGLAMRVRGGVGYWTSDSGLLVSKDKGATWAVQGSPIKAFQGPYFGKAAGHLVVVNDEGFQETTDGGRTWKVAAPLPPGIKADRMTLCAWDEKAGIFYVSRMTKPTLKYVR